MSWYDNPVPVPFCVTHGGIPYSFNMESHVSKLTPSVSPQMYLSTEFTIPCKETIENRLKLSSIYTKS